MKKIAVIIFACALTIIVHAGWREAFDDAYFVQPSTGGSVVTSTPVIHFSGNESSYALLGTADGPLHNVTNNVSITAWVRLDAYGTFIFSKMDSYTMFVHYDHTLVFSSEFRGGWEDIHSIVTVPTNVWTHLAITVDASKIYFYKDGILGDTVDAVGTMDGGAYVASLSKENHWGSQSQLGESSEIYIWNRTLASNEVYTVATTKVANISTAPWTSGLIGGWRLNEGTGTILADVLGVSTGTAYGVTWTNRNL